MSILTVKFIVAFKEWPPSVWLRNWLYLNEELNAMTENNETRQLTDNLNAPFEKWVFPGLFLFFRLFKQALQFYNRHRRANIFWPFLSRLISSRFIIFCPWPFKIKNCPVKRFETVMSIKSHEIKLVMSHFKQRDKIELVLSHFKYPRWEWWDGQTVKWRLTAGTCFTTNVEKCHPVYSAEIWTHDLQNTSLLS